MPPRRQSVAGTSSSRQTLNRPISAATSSTSARRASGAKTLHGNVQRMLTQDLNIIRVDEYICICVPESSDIHANLNNSFCLDYLLCSYSAEWGSIY